MFEGKFVGFFTNPPFWAGPMPNLTKELSENEFQGKMTQWKAKYGDKNYKILIMRDGMIYLRHELIEKLYEEHINKEISFFEKLDTRTQLNLLYFDFINCVKVLIDSAVVKKRKFDYFKPRPTAQRELLRSTIYQGLPYDETGLDGESGKYYYGRILQLYSKPLIDDRRIYSRQEIRLEYLYQAFKDIALIADSLPKIRVLSLYSSSLYHYLSLDFPSSIILGWFIIEYFINSIYNAKIKEKNSDRNPIAKKIESIRKTNLIDIDILDNIDHLRLLRNDLIHWSEKKVSKDNNLLLNPYTPPISLDDCELMFKTIAFLILREFKIELGLRFGFAYSLI
ncbi:hypothetical protein [Leptospira idonii]|uniref:Apea-like HEPN domain-containing protein n=1 Tax=Leptospira idonii TaxID=1193500 RepID=A0A4V6QMV3_9LEPT|nr:hypothetical protein [Leptospira idonii]TGN17493.1 hypothetical protein EHS15_17035 [Leptospira idonii]